MTSNTLWATAVNLSGLRFSKPVQVEWHADLGEFYDEEGDFSVLGAGVIDKDGVITFASVDIKEVEIFISGVKATMTLLNQWSTVYEE